MSAGGLEAVTPFLNAIPADSGMAFVVVQHLEPTRNSLLAELLGRQTAMPVVQIKDGARVEPNHVYVIAPAKTLLIEDGALRLIEPEEPRGQRHPIDKFFTALAEDQKSRAIAIVLSGSGSNGTAGIQDIKQAGGLCVAQDPRTATFDSMPRHAIDSGAVDLVLPPDQMPEALAQYIRHPYIKKPEASVEEDSGTKLEDVLTLLHTRTGHDFRQYKRNTLLRRIERRMSLANIQQLDGYMTMLRQTPAECDELAKDLMINVTAFFRDPEAWDSLDREVVTPIIARAERGQTIRAWTPACSTGEEAYTIAMLFAERGEATGKRLTVKIFATDPAEHNLGKARKGVFPGSMVESLSPERLARFFDKGDDDTYRIKPEIRETVLFAPQNLLKDPPYSRMDLVSCRNLLIYLEPEAQDRVLSLAHFALRENGYLFLGNAETVGQREHMFATVSKRWRIYRRVGSTRAASIDFVSWPARDEPALRPNPEQIAFKSLAARFGPASVLIDRNYNILHFHGPTDDYLAQPSGSPTADLLRLARDGLRSPIRNAVRKAIEGGQAVTVRTRAARGAKGVAVEITVNPVGGEAASGSMLLVSFIEASGGQQSVPARKADAVLERSSERDLEDELKSAREEARSTIEQYETVNEELKAANEEITSVNEELQSTNEELEASKEELQSLNEELSAVNSQLERKIDELEVAGDDMRNLLSGNDVATIFLDTAMRIKWFTPAVRPLFDLINSDVGRPISNFAQKFLDVDLVARATAAVERLATFEHEVGADSGKIYQLRVLPYRTGDNRIAGASVTFIDITDLKAIQTATSRARDYAEGIVQTIRDPLLVLGADLRVQTANAAFYARFQTNQPETTGRPVYEINGGIWNIPSLRSLLEEVLPERKQVTDFELEMEIPRIGPRSLLLNARRIVGDSGMDDRILLAVEDITERRDAARHQETMIGELSHRVKNTLAVIQSIAAQTLRRSGSLEAFAEAFQGRLQALGRAHDSVIEGKWREIGLRSVAERALSPFEATGRVVYDDRPDVPLSPKASLALAMILHELATNAAKYGALSASAGQVLISWRRVGNGDGQRVAIDWTESGGPEVKAPSRRGHGTSFVARAAAYELQGEAKIEYLREGVHAAIEFPLAAVSDGESPAPEVREGPN